MSVHACMLHMLARIRDNDGKGALRVWVGGKDTDTKTDTKTSTDGNAKAE